VTRKYKKVTLDNFQKPTTSSVTQTRETDEKELLPRQFSHSETSRIFPLRTFKQVIQSKSALKYLIAEYCICSTKPSCALRLFPRPLQLFHLFELSEDIPSTISAKTFTVESASLYRQVHTHMLITVANLVY
jgi:hypothetical protein